MTSISTKTGDKGETSLASGRRVPKDDLIFAAIGTVDELNSWLGLVVAKFGEQFGREKKQLLKVQDDLFYLGAELAQSPTTKLKSASLGWVERGVEKLQTLMSDDWHSKFLLPGGTELGAYLDIARTVCRRAERKLVALNNRESVRPLLIKYLNRLSDYLYVLRCFVNHSAEYKEKQFNSKSSS